MQEYSFKSIVAICLLFHFLTECSSKSLQGQASSNIFFQHTRASKSNHKRTLDPKELNKLPLEENSFEQENAERMIVLINGKKTLPKYITKTPKNYMMIGQLEKRHHMPYNETRQKAPFKQKRLFPKDDKVKWPNKVIPYVIAHGTYNKSSTIKMVVSKAVSRFNEAGCVQWINRTNQPTYVKIVGNEPKCQAKIGFRGLGEQTVYLYEYGCATVTIALHEMLHAAGGKHEHARLQDRNKVLSFNFQGDYTSNAREYDLGSIMQYALTFGNKTFMRVHDPELEYLTKTPPTDLTFYDKAELNAFYNCADNCTNPPVCQNEGFVKQVRGYCSCECVDGLKGRNCTQLDTSSGCGGFVTLTTGGSETIEMHGYKTGVKCTWLIKGPEKTRIQVFIDRLDLPFSPQHICYHYIEVRDYLSGSKGKLLCGDSSGANFTKKNLGPTNMMIIRFYSDRYHNITPGKGFTLTVTAAPSACSSSPCKYPASCADGINSNEYTCTCTNGYSGTNCNRVAAFASVTDSFEKDFTTLMKPGWGFDFNWTTNKYRYLNSVERTASDGFLMATLRNYFYTSGLAMHSRAGLVTSVVFEKAYRCLRFDYAIADNDLTSPVSALIVRVYDDANLWHEEYKKQTGNNWKTAEVDLPAVFKMKVNIRIEFVGVYGLQNIILDNIRITPLFCNATNPCDYNQCQNGGECEAFVNAFGDVSFQCNCKFGFTGRLCEHYVCNSTSCGNGICFPLSSSNYTCQCNSGWVGQNCNIYICADINCNQGRCETLSDTLTRCNCDDSWYGEFCNYNPCENFNCNHGTCETLSEYEVICKCDEGWKGEICNSEYQQ